MRFEIFVAVVNSIIIAPIEHKRHRSKPRLIATVLVNYAEIVLIFSLFFNFILDEGSMIKSINYSVSLATLSGLSFSRESNALFLTGIVEMLLGITFVAIVISALANYLGSRE